MRRIDRDRPDFRQVQPIKMKSAASHDATDVLQYNEVSGRSRKFPQNYAEAACHHPSNSRSVDEFVPHPGEPPHACACMLSRKRLILIRASLMTCWTRAGAVPPGTSGIASTEERLRKE